MKNKSNSNLICYLSQDKTAIVVDQRSANPRLTRFSKLLIVTALLFLAFTKANAQTYPKIYQDWSVTENAQKNIEVAYLVVKCSSSAGDSIFLNIFNEKPTADTFDVDIVIYKEDNSDSSTTHFTIKASGGQMLMHNCGSGEGLSYAILVPSGYDPAKLTVVPRIK